MKFWSFPEITGPVTINGQQKTIKIDDRTFGTPVLVQYDDQLQVKMWFELYNSPNHKTLLENLMIFPPETSFLLVNACNRIPEEWTGTQGEGLCLVRGKLGSGKIRSEHIADTVLLTAEQLQQVPEIPVAEAVYNTRIKQVALAQKRNELKD